MEISKMTDPFEDFQKALANYGLVPRDRLEDWLDDWEEKIHQAIKIKEFMEKIPNYPPSCPDPEKIRFIHIDILRSLHIQRNVKGE